MLAIRKKGLSVCASTCRPPMGEQKTPTTPTAQPNGKLISAPQRASSRPVWIERRSADSDSEYPTSLDRMGCHSGHKRGF